MSLSHPQGPPPLGAGFGPGPARTLSAGRAADELCLVGSPVGGCREGGMAALDMRPSGAAQPGCDSVKIAIKFLLSNVAAGVVIGKAGSIITELQEHSGSRIQLSRNNVFYPGTVERVLLLTGSVKNVLVALYLILVKLTGRASGNSAGSPVKAGSPTGGAENGDGSPGGEPQQPRGESESSGGSPASGKDGDGQDSPTQLKIVMPAAVCGAIIGRGGETIRSFAEDSGASISVSPQERGGGRLGDPRPPGPAPDRIVTVTGGVSQILRAVALIVTTVAEDPNYVNNVGLSVNYAPLRAGAPPPPGAFPPPRDAGMLNGGAGFPFPIRTGFAPGMPPQEPPGAFQGPIGSPGLSEVKLAVPDEHVGAIIGKGGEILAQLQALVGVKVTISGRGEFTPGTRDRNVCISGPRDAVQIAQLLVTQKLNERLHQLQR
eukprot:evm.model.scf_2581.1 EVM.evm.TU.scf_2581.1   scf_2581:3565-4863(+)